MVFSAYLFNIPMLAPCEFTMTGYSKHKRDKDCWLSPPFYTRLGGYKMCLKVYANGYDTGAGTHVTASVHLMRGEHDDQLKWPFQGVITVQLLNQKKDQGHVEDIIEFSVAAVANGAAARVTSGEYATLSWGLREFIPHSAVESTTETTQYLHTDCLKWRVTNIVVRSV